MTRKKLYLLSILLLIISCKSSKVKHGEEPILLGDILLKELKQNNYAQWFNKNYDDYILKTQHLKKLKNIDQDYTIEIILGTWCPDSKRQVPRVLKILDSIGYTTSNIYLHALDRDKKLPLQLKKKYNITRVPTLIIKRDNKEINRIVEIPVESLEQDLLNILTKNTYKNAYAE